MRSAHAEERRHDVDQPEREDRDQAQHQEVAQRVAAKAFLHAPDAGPGLGAQGIAERGPGDQEDDGGADGGTDQDEERAGHDAEQKAAGDGEDRTTGHRERDHGGI